MSNFKGTKGKWGIDNDTHVIYSNRTTSNVVCMIPDKICVESRKLWQANALLISKAPEMLKMLERLVDRMEENDLGNFHSVKMAKLLIKEATEL